MKKSILTIGLGSLLVLSGCGDSRDNDQRTGIVDTTPTRLNAASQYYDEDYRGANNDSDNFGYTRVNSGTGENENGTEAPTIDREQLADIISRLGNQIPDVNDVSTLVTDEEVLVVYDSDTNNRNATADQVKRTALSIVPRYFHVYVSDNETLRQNIENFATQDTDSRGIEDSIDSTIRQMLKSPQGNKVSDGENANGESIGDRR
ncbi:YhcN/YlaJ family sporulation lipoprotein [Bacillus sp. V59.32b]|uniref:YhcN/YlaJ family sporulation lipoprotein n=1 Tax=Bacillus sp. V59.32b TaxID=1758642 RepID=UPI000E3B7F5F|nr:YhcN/YlaJ family sporulation lipoprotein [Bacillus sp. V59.32b]RFU67219.1 sporulation protein [Bacillus sp. V59.32b]